MASHLTFREREFLYRLLKARKPKAEIAELMGRDRSTIYREIKRNTGGRGYRPKQAQRAQPTRTGKTGHLRCQQDHPKQGQLNQEPTLAAFSHRA